MDRPAIGFVASSAMVMLLAPGVFGQALPILPTTGSSATTSSSSTTTPTPSASPVDLTHMNWRFGQMSPYAQQPVTSSATTQSTVPPPSSVANNNNLFVGSTLATQGSLITNGSASTPTAIQPAVNGSTGLLNNSTYVSRFVNFNNLVPNFGVTTPLTPPPANNFVDLNTFAPSGSALTAVPEPTTIIMCGGLLALVGYGYSRRQLKTEVKAEEKPTDEQSEPIEPVGV